MDRKQGVLALRCPGCEADEASRLDVIAYLDKLVYDKLAYERRY
jgi:hypothetical protein